MRRTIAIASCFAALLSGCKKDDPAPTPRPEDSAAPSAAFDAKRPSATVPAEPPPPPTLVLQKLEVPGHDELALHHVEGALMVSSKYQVGRILDGKVDWVGKIEKEQAHLGPNTINQVLGRWPDAIDVLFSNDNGRAPVPTYHPLTGVGIRHTFAEGGGFGWISGVATVGASTVVAGYSFMGTEIITVRGPKLELRQQTTEQAGCTREELEYEMAPEAQPAIRIDVLGATPAGTVLALGALCRRRPPALEVWKKGPTSTVMDLSRFIKSVEYAAKLLPGKGDEMFVYSGAKGPILRFHAGELAPLPKLERPIQHVFISSKRELLVSDGRNVRRYDGKGWQLTARLAWPSQLSTMLEHEGQLWGAAGSIYRLVPSESVAARDGCKTPFVYLYDVSVRNPADFDFPSTVKALSSFEGADDLELVEVTVDGWRRLGVIVRDQAQGKAVIAHVVREMKDEHPELMCFAPTEKRTIALGSKK